LVGLPSTALCPHSSFLVRYKSPPKKIINISISSSFTGSRLVLPLPFCNLYNTD
jgi:hypothetical protein